MEDLNINKELTKRQEVSIDPSLEKIKVIGKREESAGREFHSLAVLEKKLLE